ncbi:hypothetical protein QOZ80_5AG0387220 [Eleusine coracana subsp. coracana]|nr:hypothetical protein QOZ80_5AG0387220 [Eleusine coracana subsp. coracana]
MGTCSRAEIMRWCLAIHPKGLCCLVFRVLPKLLGLPHSLLKKFQKDEHLHEHEQEMESGTELGNLPELSQDILMAIFATLEIPDLLRASSVCSSWHSTYTSLASLWQYNKNQTPCLLYTSESAGDNVACLYNLAEQRVYKLTLPDPPIRSRYIIGSSNGWLATVSEACEVHLVNPITGQQINLPSVITIEQVKPIHDNSCSTDMYEYSWRTGTEEPYTPSIFSANVLQDRLFYKAFMFSNTSTGSYFVVLIHNRFGQLSFARVGDDKWTWLAPYTGYLDCIYMDALLYAITTWGEIHVFDLSDPIITGKIIMYVNSTQRGNTSYIIRVASGNLLHIRRSETEEDNYDPEVDLMTFVRHTGNIEIYKLDIAAKTVVETNCLHNNILFIGHNNRHFVCKLKNIHLLRQIMPTLLMTVNYGWGDTRIIAVILEYSTWIVTAGRNSSLLGFGPIGRLLFGLRPI